MRTRHLPFSDSLPVQYLLGRLLEKGESVVCLCQPFEMLYEIIEIVNHWINTLGVTRPTLHVVSPVAFESLNLCSMVRCLIRHTSSILFPNIDPPLSKSLENG